LRRDLRNLRDLVIVLTAKEIKVRYKNNLLGYLWSIANPLAFAFVFFVAFKVVMRIQMEDYSLFLISALFPWQWFANSVNISPSVFLGNAGIIKKVSFWRAVIPFAMVLQDMFHFIFSIPVIIAFLFLFGKSPSLSWFYGIPVLLFLQLLITFGISLVVSSINLFFRDMERLTAILTTFLFYFTPIIYPESMIPEKYAFFINLNPLSPLMVSWRNLFLYGSLNPSHLGLASIYAFMALAFGCLVYGKLSWRFAEAI